MYSGFGLTNLTKSLYCNSSLYSESSDIPDQSVVYCLATENLDFITTENDAPISTEVNYG